MNEFQRQIRFSAVLAAIVVSGSAFGGPPPPARTPIVIAHRSASGYLPEHTLVGAAFAHAAGADFIEPDLVLTRDDVPVVLHDIHLEETTNAARIFPDRKRADGRWYAIDFTLQEIKTLRVNERINRKTGAAVFPKRFPAGESSFDVPTFRELATLVDGLNHSRGKHVGLYPELKSPAFHTKEGKNIAKIVIDILAEMGKNNADAPIFLQCFDPPALIYIKEVLKSPLPLIQLIGENEWHEADVDYDAMRTPEGLKKVAAYATGIGPNLSQLFSVTKGKGKPVIAASGLAATAHKLGMLVHPYTMRIDQLPEGVPDAQAFHKLIFGLGAADGLFTDFTDVTVAFLRK